MLNIIIFGAPGSGKGTESALLVKKYGFVHISTGEVLRAEIKKCTALGLTAKSYIDQGQLIPDELMTETLADVYDSIDKTTCSGVVFDGFPRTIPQANALKNILAKREQHIDLMLELTVPESILIQRLIQRGIATGRSDDNEETISKRLKVYETQTAPLINYYKTEGLYHGISNEGTIEQVFESLCDVIDQYT